MRTGIARETVFDFHYFLLQKKMSATSHLVALKEIVDSAEVNNTIRATRAWKLLLLLPRMLLFRPTRGGLVPRKKLEARFREFQGGEWIQLLGEGTQCALEHIPGPPDAVGGATMTTGPESCQSPVQGAIAVSVRLRCVLGVFAKIPARRSGPSG